MVQLFLWVLLDQENIWGTQLIRRRFTKVESCWEWVSR